MTGVVIGLVCFLAIPAAFLLYLAHAPSPRCACGVHTATTQTPTEFHGVHLCCPMEEVIVRGEEDRTP